MPECVSVSEFVQEVQEDWSSPTTSSFTSKMINCRNTIYLLEEVSAVSLLSQGTRKRTHWIIAIVSCRC
uniref:Uncharacterized protein n=1 Tax=Cyprinodon variegatus TaxID=28743 RepID=A0A3Q2G9V8_CYPVA